MFTITKTIDLVELIVLTIVLLIDGTSFEETKINNELSQRLNKDITVNKRVPNSIPVCNLKSNHIGLSSSLYPNNTIPYANNQHLKSQYTSSILYDRVNPNSL